MCELLAHTWGWDIDVSVQESLWCVLRAFLRKLSVISMNGSILYQLSMVPNTCLCYKQIGSYFGNMQLCKLPTRLQINVSVLWQSTDWCLLTPVTRTSAGCWCPGDWVRQQACMTWPYNHINKWMWPGSISVSIFKVFFLLSWSKFACKKWRFITCHKQGPGPWFNIKTSSCQYRKSHCGDKTILRPFYLHNGISYTGKMTSLYWIKDQCPMRQLWFGNARTEQCTLS